MADPFLRWISRVLRERREQAGLPQVRIAVELNVNQETVARFERGQAWPRQVDFIYRYAATIGADPLDMFEEAVARWRAERLLTAQVLDSGEQPVDRDAGG